MCKKTVIAQVVFTLLGASVAQATPIITLSNNGLPPGDGPTPGGNDLYVFNTDPNGTVFDTIDVTIVATVGTFVGENNPAIVWFSPPGGDETDFLGLNTVALGWSLLVSSDTPTLLAGAGGPLGQDITVPVDLVQIAVPPGFRGTYTFNFADNGVLVDTQSGIWPIPEPASAVLALMGFSLIGGRRR